MERHHVFGVLVSGKSFFFCGSDQLAINIDRSRRIVGKRAGKAKYNKWQGNCSYA